MFKGIVSESIWVSIFIDLRSLVPNTKYCLNLN